MVLLGYMRDRSVPSVEKLRDEMINSQYDWNFIDEKIAAKSCGILKTASYADRCPSNGSGRELPIPGLADRRERRSTKRATKSTLPE